MQPCRELLAYINDTSENEMSPATVKKLIDEGADPDAVRNDIETALMIACRCGYHEVAKDLLQAGALVDTTVLYGATALMVAAEFSEQTVAAKVLESLGAQR